MLNNGQKKASTNPVFLSMSRVGDEMSNLGAEVFPDGPTHVMNQIHQVLLHRKQKIPSTSLALRREYKYQGAIS